MDKDDGEEAAGDGPSRSRQAAALRPAGLAAPVIQTRRRGIEQIKVVFQMRMALRGQQRHGKGRGGILRPATVAAVRAIGVVQIAVRPADLSPLREARLPEAEIMLKIVGHTGSPLTDGISAHASAGRRERQNIKYFFYPRWLADFFRQRPKVEKKLAKDPLSAYILSRAEVVELVDTLGSGSSSRKGVGVRVSPSAPAKSNSWHP